MTHRPAMMILSFSTLRSDPRILRQIAAFTDAFEITTVGYGEKPAGADHHVEIPSAFDSLRPSFRHLMALLAARQYRRAYFGSRRIKYVLDQVAPRSMDVIVANDVDAVPVALRLRPRGGVHADLHEYSPRQRENEAWWKILVSPFLDWIVRRFVTKADSVTTVSPGLARQYEHEYGISAAVVPNAAPFRVDVAVRPTPRAAPIRIVHTGAAGRSRRLETMIDAVAAVNRITPGAFTFDLYLKAGDAPYIDELRNRADEVGGGAIRVLDPVPFDQLIPTMSTYDVGLYSCPPENFNQRFALPNKLFEFVQARLAVVIGPSEDMRTYVDAYGIGRVADGFATEDLSAVLAEVTPDVVDQLKEASDAAARPLSAESLSDEWTKAIARLSPGPVGGAV